MKTVTSTLLMILLLLPALSLAGPKLPSAQLVDMYALKEGDGFVVHILANGNITEFLSDRKKDAQSYKLTLDVPALSPMDAKYDVDTPFSRRFEIWPMQLDGKIYSRIEIELDLSAASVVGMQNPSHLFVRIERDQPSPLTRVADSPPAQPVPQRPQALSQTAPVAVTPLGVLPMEMEPEDPSTDGGTANAPTMSDNFDREPEGDSTKPVANEASASSGSPSTADGNVFGDVDGLNDEELFFNLFPTPAHDQQTLFNVALESPVDSGMALNGIRVGRFLLQPQGDVSYMNGSNLLLQDNLEATEDSALFVRGRVVATLLESTQKLQMAYEARYRSFRDYDYDEGMTNVFDISSNLILTPRTRAEIKNHYIRGSFEAQEIDPGGELAVNTDAFYRNITEGAFDFDVTERLGIEVSGSYNRVEFLEFTTEFFNYDTSTIGGGLYYNLSPLTSLIGEYFRSVTPAPLTRPAAGSTANLLLFGIRGEITPLLRGRIRGGYTDQIYDQGLIPQQYRGFIADVMVTRDFGEKSALNIDAGRRTTPSAFEGNGFYISNYFSAQFVTPLARNIRLAANAGYHANDYPLLTLRGEAPRNDRLLRATVGVSYFFTPLTFIKANYRYDKRNSNLERFDYQNNAFQVIFGVGFLNR